MRLFLAIAALLLSGLAVAQDISLPDYERVVLDNGTVLLLAEKHDVPLVGLQALVRGGTAADPVDRDTVGRSHFLHKHFWDASPHCKIFGRARVGLCKE